MDKSKKGAVGQKAESLGHPFIPYQPFTLAMASGSLVDHPGSSSPVLAAAWFFTSSVPEKTIMSSSGSLMSSSVRDYKMILFVLSGDEEFFEEVSERNMQPGDIVLVPFLSATGLNSTIFQHAAVYCGDGEVIHFQGTSPFGKSGLISKEGFNAMKKERGKFRILRKKGGINLNAFRCKVRNAMCSEAYYDLCTNNCIHFALYLLDMAEFYMKLVSLELGVTGVVGQKLPVSPPLLPPSKAVAPLFCLWPPQANKSLFRCQHLILSIKIKKSLGCWGERLD
ncbi:uncharacterized protein LOC142603452 [Balearica regulorum gibbericeps]|uniref:uncharacterized protein LOC142603452 n=1 Tax=Balearica regulorum gibbericeps TaxID=100784 RepID=UPI003F623267